MLDLGSKLMDGWSGHSEPVRAQASPAMTTVGVPSVPTEPGPSSNKGAPPAADRGARKTKGNGAGPLSRPSPSALRTPSDVQPYARRNRPELIQVKSIKKASCADFGRDGLLRPAPPGRSWRSASVILPIRCWPSAPTAPGIPSTSMAASEGWRDLDVTRGNCEVPQGTNVLPSRSSSR